MACSISEHGLAADATAVFDVSLESLADKYLRDESEAAKKLKLAEKQLDEEEYERALMTAREAADSFRSVADRSGTIDSERMLVRAYCLLSQSRLYAEGATFKTGGREALKSAEDLCREKVKEHEAAKDKRGEAAMRLASAEVAFASPDVKQQQEVERLATAALKVAEEAKDVSLQAGAMLLLASASLRVHLVASAAEQAKQAREFFSNAGNKKGEAKALQVLGASTAAMGSFDEGLEWCAQAAEIYRALGAKQMEAFVCYSMAQLFICRRMGAEAVGSADDAMALFRASQSRSTANVAYAASLVVQANIIKSDSGEALRVATEGMEGFRRRGDKRGQALMAAAAASVHVSKEDFAEAQKMFDEATACVQELSDQRWEGSILRELSAMHLRKGALEEASAAASEAVSAFQSAGDRLGEAYALRSLVDVHMKKENFFNAMQVANEQRAIFQELGDRSKEAAALLLAAGGLSNDNSLDQAIALADEAFEICEEIQDADGVCNALMAQSEIQSQREEIEVACNKAKEMKLKAKETGNTIQQAQACRSLAQACQAGERLVEAVRAANEAVSTAKKTAYKPLVVDMLLMAVKVNTTLVLQDGSQASARGTEKAVRPAREAVSMAKATGSRSLICQCTYQLAEVQLMSYQLGKAMDAAKEALKMYRDIEDKVGEAGAVILIAETHYAGGRFEKAEEQAKDGIQLAASCGDQRKEQYGTALLEQIKESRKASQPAVQPQMVPMQMSQQMAAAPAQGQAPQEQAVSAAAPKQVGLDAAMVQSTVQEMARQAIGVDDGDLTLDSALMDSGMDSLTAVSFRNGLQTNLGVKLPSSLMFDYPTMKEVANRIVELSIENA